MHTYTYKPQRDDVHKKVCAKQREKRAKIEKRVSQMIADKLQLIWKFS